MEQFTNEQPLDDSPAEVFNSSEYLEAAFVASVLNGSGIETFLTGDVFSPNGRRGLGGGTKVIVRAEDVERAREILASKGA